MNDKNGKMDDGAALIPAQTSAEPGYEEWLKSQLEQTVADRDDPAREEIGHETVFEKLDTIIARHEAP